MAKENPEREDVGMEWVTGATPPDPQCKSQRKPLVGPEAQRQIARQKDQCYFFYKLNS